jgi:transcriptional antiterminator RfaH
MELTSKSGSRWIVLRTRTRQEIRAQENAHQIGFVTYLPKILQAHKRNGIKTMVAEPLFPSYLFCAISDRWRILLNTFGVSGVIMRGNEPDSLPKSVIEDLRSRETFEGFVELPKKPKPIGLNSKIRVNSGPFAGHFGLVAGMAGHQRCRVLLDLLGRKVTVLVSESGLSVAA